MQLNLVKIIRIAPTASTIDKKEGCTQTLTDISSYAASLASNAIDLDRLPGENSRNLIMYIE